MWGFFPPTILYRKAGTSGCYNPNHGTWLERVGGGGMWPLGYKSSFFMFGE